MRHFICGLTLGSLLTASLGLAISDDGDYWWYKNQQQNKQGIIESIPYDRQDYRGQDYRGQRKEPC
jgi:hypothetical protein